MNKNVKFSAIGNLLIRAALIDSSGLERALGVQSKKGGSLGKILADLGLADENAVSAAVARELRIEFAGTQLPEVLPKSAALLPLEYCRTRLVAPLSLEGRSLRLAMVDPLDYATIQDVIFTTNKEVVAVSASETWILALLGKSGIFGLQSSERHTTLRNMPQKRKARH
jgi:hypothetical protein